eukprot:PhM_4_TR3162/c1_g1_i1/m.63630
MLRRFMFAGIGCGVASFCSQPVDSVWAKPRDTPQYLLPYYLKTTRSRFNHFASIRDGESRARYMTAEDFLRSLLVTKKSDAAVSPNVVRDLDRLFRALDADGDGRLSYAEYSMLMVFLTRAIKEFRVAFHIFDQEESGTIGVAEFRRLMNSLRIDSGVNLDFQGGLTEMFFGNAYNKRLSESELIKFVEELKMEVLKAEFRQFDPEGEGHITPKDFCQLITNSMLGSHLPFYIVNNIRHLHADGDKVGFEHWRNFSTVMDVCDDLAVAMQLYAGTGRAMMREDFIRALRAVSPNKSADKKTVDLIFALFDKNGDGTLEFEEFISVVRTKAKYNHFRKPKEGGRTPPQQFIHCMNTLVFDGALEK